MTFGCATLQLCCTGRNHSCKATVYDYYAKRDATITIRKVTRKKRLIKLLEFRADEKFPLVLTRRAKRRVGEMILPGIVALDPAAAVAHQLIRKYGANDGLRVIFLDKTTAATTERSSRLKRGLSYEEYFVFGTEAEEPPDIERTIFERARPIIRYSVLNKYLPLRVGKLPKASGQHADDYLLGDRMRVMYVTEANADCFCDAECIIFGDCCHDYLEYCNPHISEPCFYTAWSSWSKCQSSDNYQRDTCGGEGSQIRTRKIESGARYVECALDDRLAENRACFAPCERDEVMTVTASSTRLSAPPRIEEKQHATRTKTKSTQAVTTTTRATTTTTTISRLTSRWHQQHHLPNIQQKKLKKDLTTVALLLDYRFNESRMIKQNNYHYQPPHLRQHHYDQYRHHNQRNHYDRHFLNDTMQQTSAAKAPTTAAATSGSGADTFFELLPTDDKRYDQRENIFYCVHYELSWVNRNCVERRYKTALQRRNRICVECQPQAQLHRATHRCASDLEDDEKGFWKLIGPLSCNGIWHRMFRTNNCSCASHFPDSAAFLLV